MTTSRTIIQLILISIGLLLILATYFLYPKIKESNLPREETRIDRQVDENFINQKIKERNDARRKGNYELADILRKELEDKGVIIEDKQDQTTWMYKKDMLDEQSNTFENVEYNGIYNINNPFVVMSEKALILSDESDLIYMTKMKVTVNMNDGRIIVITSDKGKYNKVTYDCYFEVNVKATDGGTILLSDNLDLVASDDIVSIYNNVRLNNDNGSLIADKIDYDFETKYYKVSMFDDKRVKVKLIE